MKNSSFVGYGEVIDGTIKSVIVRSGGVSYKIHADFFIDALTDASLVRSVKSNRNIDYLYGRDYQSKFGESLAIVSGNKNYLNEPNIFFEISNEVDDSDLLATITTVTRNGNTVNAPDYITGDGYEFSILGSHYVNPMTGAGYQGMAKLLMSDHDYQTKMRKRTLEYWKFIKLQLQIAYENGQSTYRGWNVSSRTYGFVDFLGMVSDRETFRINCDEMLTQNELSTLATNDNEVIAVGSHNIDFHITNGLNVADIENFNDNLLKPYAIKYGSIIPVGLKNVFVASKCFGSSQIANASARISKVINQLGWTAGNAVLLAIENGLTDVRNVNLSTLKSSSYTDFNDRFATLMSHYNG
jgi:hypothetical protein